MEPQERPREEVEVERKGSWNYPELCEQLGQRLMVLHLVVEEELVAQALLVEVEELGQQREQMGEVEGVPGLMRQEEAVDQKAFEMLEAAVLAESCFRGEVEELGVEEPRGQSS